MSIQAPYYGHAMPTAGPSVPKQSSRNARSSRRTRQSAGPAVMLGGGAGQFGSVVDGHHRATSKLLQQTRPEAYKGGQRNRGPSYPFNFSDPQAESSSPFYAGPSTHPIFPVQFSSSSPTSPNFPPSETNSSSDMYRSPSPLPQTSQSHQAHQSHHGHHSQASQGSRKSSHPGSTSSLSTTASTSSRTLRTPHSKLDQHHASPFIVGSTSMTSHGSNGSIEGSYSSPTPAMPVKRRSSKESGGRGEMRSPTPTQRIISRPDQSPPALTRGPLPPPPNGSPTRQKKSSHPFSAAATPSSLGARSTRNPVPVPLDNQKQENRISQDWVQVSLSQESLRPKRAIESTIPYGARLPPVRLPSATMVPMKDDSPKRPTFDRAQSEPLSASDEREQRVQRQGRGSLDQLRTTNVPGLQPRIRNNALSTPPSLVLEAGHSNGRTGLFHSGPSRSFDSASIRRSEDTLRPSLDTIRPNPSFERRDTRAEAKEQHRALGVATSSSPAVDPDERKASGLSLKKSSGALKALFSRGASGKGNRAETPPVPSLENAKLKSKRPSTAPKETSLAMFGESSDQTPEKLQAGKAMGESEAGRRSLGVDRSLYPAPPFSRNLSEGNTVYPTRQRLPSRELPPLPPLSPVPAPTIRSSSTVESPSTEQMKTSQNSLQGIEQGEKPAKPQLSLLADTLPCSSLPYLSPLRASFLLEQSEAAKVAAQTSTQIDRPPSTPPMISKAASSPPSLPTLPLDLLSLPKLDLDFDFTFDKFDISPSTPRRTSPQKQRGSPLLSTSTRSLTTRLSPHPSPKITRANSERRRSQSVDEHKSPVAMWTSSGFDSPDLSKLFGSANSSSAPILSKPLQPTMSDDSHKDDQSDSSHHTSLESHQALTNATSIDNTASPSPPQTPEIGADLPELPASQKTYNAPPSIPLPALPAPTPALAPAAIIEELKPIKSTNAAALPPRTYVPTLLSRSIAVLPDPSRPTASLAKEMEKLLYTFRAPSPPNFIDRTNMIRTELVPLLREVDKRTFVQDEPGLKTLREACFGWIDTLLLELRVEQPANERGACLEGLAAIFESACLSEHSLDSDSAHRAKFVDATVKCMTFVMSKLGAKGVFHNTLLFSGRFLAFAFFRIPHVGEQLVTVLPPPRGALMRFTRSALLDSQIPAQALPSYPKHLEALCFDDSRKYSARLASLSAEFATEKERDAFLFASGNWLRRWQSDDSELFPSFYRAYHKLLAVYLGPAIAHYESLDQPLPASILLRAPGYAHLATIFANKCHSYILGSVNAVTTSSSAQHFEATETAGFRGSQKPAVLETANRRLVETISTFAQSRVLVPSQSGVMECEGQQLYAGMMDLWTKRIISKTNLYAPKGVFCLFDLLDGIVDPPIDHLTGERRLTEPSLLDVPHLIYIIRMILTEGEHALTLVKVIAFVFTHWEVLTARHEDRKELCLDLLLDKKLFERLLLFWSQSVRSYVLRLVVFRLGHLHTQKGDGAAHDVEIESVRLLQTRLDNIKKRHDELEPKAPSEPDEDKEEPYLTPYEGGSMPRSRSTITMVTDSPHTGSVNKAEKLLGLGFGNVEKGSIEVEEAVGGKMGKATNWFKKSFGAKKSKKLSPNPTSTPSFANPPSNVSTPGMRDTFRVPNPTSPIPESPVSSGDSHSPTAGEMRKARPPKITTSEASPVTADMAKSPNSIAFEFELPTMSPRSDTFDPTPTAVPASPRRNSQPPSPRQPQSPHMSRSFSKRSSLLPPPTASILASESPSPIRRLVIKEEEPGYKPKLHAYAVRMLAELEDAQKEYDEWWAEGGVGRMDGAPPRLTVAWPFHEGED